MYHYQSIYESVQLLTKEVNMNTNVHIPFAAPYSTFKLKGVFEVLQNGMWQFEFGLNLSQLFKKKILDSPVLDEADSPIPGENGDSDRTVPGKQIIRRTQSVPTERDAANGADYQVVHGRRNLKMMARENLERPPFF